MDAFKKVLNPGAVKIGNSIAQLFIKVEWDGKRLSITGVEGPKYNGDCIGSCGQCIDSLSGIVVFAPDWTADKAKTLAEVWERWHLNDMRPACEHQRAEDWGSGKLEVISYKLTTEAYTERNEAISHAAECAASNAPVNLTDTQRALILLKNWFSPVFAPPDADSPLSGCYEVEKRETKLSGWVTENEHPRGVLSKPCPTCGYKYGSAWITEDVPSEILTFLKGLPDTTIKPNWV